MIKAIEKAYLKEDFIYKTFISNIKIDDKINFNKNDIYFFGNYDDNKLIEIKNKLNNNKKNILNAVEKGVKFLIMGNSIELFNNSFKYNDINLFTSYNKSKKFLIINDISKGINTYNFRYKNMICIENIKAFNRYQKRQSKLLCHTNFKW